MNTLFFPQTSFIFLVGSYLLLSQARVMQWLFCWGETLPPRNFTKKLQSQVVLSLWYSLHCSTRERKRWCHCKNSALHATSYRRTYKNPEPDLFWFTSDMFLKRPISSNQDSYVFYIWGSLQAKAVPRKDHFTHQRSLAKSTFKCLTLDTLLWRGIMSTNLQNPKEQDDCKRTLSNQPWLTHITPTVLLGSWGWQPLEDITSLGTDLETHAYWQGYTKEPTGKDLVARNTCTIASCKAQEIHWNWIKCKERCGDPPEAVIR